MEKLMIMCWKYRPEERPDFKECGELLKDLLVFKEQLAEIPSLTIFSQGSAEQQGEAASKVSVQILPDI